MDVDDYNRRGFYYNSPVDTIGMSAEAELSDFVYTQQIQKYYNPTIVLDNSDMLADVLENSYGNVDIIINDFGIPSFRASVHESMVEQSIMELGLGTLMVMELGTVVGMELGSFVGMEPLMELGLGTVVDVGSRMGMGRPQLGWS